MMWYDGHRVALAGEDLPGAGALHHRHHVPPLLPHPRRVPRQLGVRGHPAALRIAGTGGGGRKCERLPNVLARPAEEALQCLIYHTAYKTLLFLPD